MTQSHPYVAGHVEVGLCGHIHSQQSAGTSDAIEIIGQRQCDLRCRLTLKLLQQGHDVYAGLFAYTKQTHCEIAGGFCGTEHRSKIAQHSVIGRHRHMLFVAVKSVKDLHSEICLGVDGIDTGHVLAAADQITQFCSGIYAGRCGEIHAAFATGQLSYAAGHTNAGCHAQACDQGCSQCTGAGQLS